MFTYTMLFQRFFDFLRCCNDMSTYKEHRNNIGIFAEWGLLIPLGIFDERPPQPKYTIIWNLLKVVGYMSILGNTDNFTIKVLTLKQILKVTTS